MLVLQEDQAAFSAASILGRKKQYVCIVANWWQVIYTCMHIAYFDDGVSSVPQPCIQLSSTGGNLPLKRLDVDIQDSNDWLRTYVCHKLHIRSGLRKSAIHVLQRMEHKMFCFLQLCSSIDLSLLSFFHTEPKAKTYNHLIGSYLFR
jgi:hypothetical protein